MRSPIKPLHHSPPACRQTGRRVVPISSATNRATAPPCALGASLNLSGEAVEFIHKSNTEGLKREGGLIAHVSEQKTEGLNSKSRKGLKNNFSNNKIAKE